MKEQNKQFALVNGIAYGEESKGNTVQAVVRELDAHTVWRSGGWQGGHHIVHDDGREIALSFYGAGVFEGTDTYLHHMAISPVEMFEEAMQLEDLGVPEAIDSMSFHESCLSTNPYHSSMSRTREVLRGVNRKGTIGKGVGEAIKDAHDPELTIRAREFSDRATVIRKLETIRRVKLQSAEELLATYPGTPPDEIHDEMRPLYDASMTQDIADTFQYAADIFRITDDEYLQRLLEKPGAIVNEVSHGALHHPRYGFIPHVTQIDPTSRDVFRTINEHGYDGSIIRLGIVRSYLTRHGAGPFMSHNQELTNSLHETHNNGANDWLGDFRVGHFDIVALKYALAFSSAHKQFDGLLVSYMDVLKDRSDWGVVERYVYQGEATDLETYFELQNGEIVGINVHPDDDPKAQLEHQSRLTQLLAECEPVVTLLNASEDRSMEEVFSDFVEESLGVPIIGTAYGPRVTDRHFNEGFRKALATPTTIYQASTHD